MEVPYAKSFAGTKCVCGVLVHLAPLCFKTPMMMMMMMMMMMRMMRMMIVIVISSSIAMFSNVTVILISVKIFRIQCY